MNLTWTEDGTPGAIFYDEMELALDDSDWRVDICEAFCTRFNDDLPFMTFISAQLNEEFEEVEPYTEYTSWGTRVPMGYLAEFKVNDGGVRYGELVVTYYHLRDGVRALRKVYCIIDFNDTADSNIVNLVRKEEIIKRDIA